MILTTAITWAILADPMTWVIATLAATNVFAVWKWLSERQMRAWWKDAAHHVAKGRDAATARADHYASSWGRIMRKLRLAEQANLDLRTELMRRQTAEREVA